MVTFTRSLTSMVGSVYRFAGIRSRIMSMYFILILLTILLMCCHLQGLAIIVLLILRDATLCVLDNPALTSLSTKASVRLHQAFRPKTHRAYDAMFRTFIAFCIVTKSALSNINVKVILSFLECLVKNSC